LVGAVVAIIAGKFNFFHECSPDDEKFNFQNYTASYACYNLQIRSYPESLRIVTGFIDMHIKSQVQNPKSQIQKECYGC
jgi:hypothetical protein